MRIFGNIVHHHSPADTFRVIFNIKLSHLVGLISKPLPVSFRIEMMILDNE